MPIQHISDNVLKTMRRASRSASIKNTIDKLRKELDATTIIVRREEIEDIEQSNSADLNVFNYEYDLIIDNNSSLEWLEVEAINFVNKFVI